MIRRNPGLILFGVCIAAVTVLFLVPNPPEAASGPPGFDKIAHAAVFFILALLLFKGLEREGVMKKKVIFIAAVSLTGYGLMIEGLQYFSGRSPEFGDVLADIAGVAGGCILSIFFFD